MFSCFRIVLVLVAFFHVLTVQQKLATAQTNTGQSAAVDWRGKRQALEFQFGQDLVKIAGWCNNNGLARQVPSTYKLKLNRDLSRQYLFLPIAESMPDPNQQAGQLKEWQEKINAAKVAHAGRIFELAKRAMKENAPATAYQLLYEVIYHDHDHAQARRILGHKPKDGAWQVASKTFRSRPSSKRHEYLAIDQGQYLLVETAHFKIGSTASEERTRYLATQLELWHTVWRQIFFDYWGSKTRLTKSFNGEQTMSISKRKFEVFFFQNKQQYAALLAPLVPNIGVSSGYYSNKLKTSFFYDGDAAAEATWRHELTHQLFRESKRSRSDAFDKNFIWLDEGVATYAESMVELDNYVTLGGFEALRTQYARQQALLEQTPLPSAQLNAMSQQAWQARSDPKLYSQSAAIVDMLMNDSRGMHERDLISLLKTIYFEQARADSFNRLVHLSFDQVDQQLLQFLKIKKDTVSKYLSKPETRTYLILTAAKMTNSDYRELGKCINLETLDLSGQIIAAKNLQPLSNCPALNQLILSSCRFEPNAILELSKLPGLTKLNLSLSQIGPAQANEITRLKQRKPGLVVIQ